MRIVPIAKLLREGNPKQAHLSNDPPGWRSNSSCYAAFFDLKKAPAITTTRMITPIPGKALAPNLRITITNAMSVGNQAKGWTTV